MKNLQYQHCLMSRMNQIEMHNLQTRRVHFKDQKKTKIVLNS